MIIFIFKVSVGLPSFSKALITICLNPCPCVCHVISTSFDVFSGYFHVSTDQVGGISHCLNFDKFCDTAP